MVMPLIHVRIKHDTMVGIEAYEFWRERDEQNRSKKKDDKDNESWKVLPNFDA